MRIAVVYFPDKNSNRLESCARELAKGMEAQGHQVDCINGKTSLDVKMTIYRYIAVGTEAVTVFGRISNKIAPFLGSSGTVQGKPAFAFVTRKLFGTQKALLKLMAVMEKEGMVIRYSDILFASDYALEIGKRLKIGL